MYVCTYGCTYVCMYACMYVCMIVYVCLYMCVCTYIYTYTVSVQVSLVASRPGRSWRCSEHLRRNLEKASRRADCEGIGAEPDDCGIIDLMG